MLATLFLSLALLMQTSPAIVTLARGPISQVEDAQQVVARSQAEWNRLWTSHAPGQPPPAVDFSKEMVAAVFLGTRPTGGFNVEITGARREAGTLVIAYAERRPGAGMIAAQILTSPFHIVRLSREDGPVRFEAAQIAQ